MLGQVLQAITRHKRSSDLVSGDFFILFFLRVRAGLESSTYSHTYGYPRSNIVYAGTYSNAYS